MENMNLSNYNKNDLFWKDFVNLPNNPYRLNSNMSSFNCLLIYPNRKGDLSKQYYPTPLGHMASLLRMNNGKAKISVEDVESYNTNNFANYNLICFYPMVASFPQMTNLTSNIKKDYPNSKICFFNSDQHQHEMLLCNPKAKGFAKKMMEKNPFIDYILVGEAESSFIKLCEKINNKDNNFGDIPSFLYREDGEIKTSKKPIEPVDFKFLPFPARDYLETTMTKEGINTSSPRIQASRGCVSPCSYCVESSSNITEGGRRMPILLRDISKAVDEIEMLQKNYGVAFFNSIDSSFEDPGTKGIERMKQFCDEIQKRGIEASFKIHMRAETVEKLEDDFLATLKCTGIDVIGTGVESGLKKELESYKKIATVEQSRRGIQRLIDNNFFIILGHMMFSPVLELGDLSKKVDFLKEIHYGWDYLSLSNNVVIYPGTAYHQYIKEKGLELEHDELSTRVPYRFKDERVREVANAMGNLKITCPSTIQVHNLLYDSMNIATRYHNKINQHLWKNAEEFKIFRANLDEQLFEVEEAYTSFFMGLVNLAESGFSQDRTRLIYRKYILSFFPEMLKRAQQNIQDFISGCEKKNLSTDKLYLKSWFSMRDSQNTVGGKNE